jgi:hypothetical protein
MTYLGGKSLLNKKLLILKIKTTASIAVKMDDGLNIHIHNERWISG